MRPVNRRASYDTFAPYAAPPPLCATANENCLLSS